MSASRILRTDPIYPGNGLPPRPGEDRPGLSPFGRLVMGQSLGQSSILIYDHRAEGVQPAQADMISIQGDDLDACQMSLVLHPPRVIPLSFEEVACTLAQQNLTNEQSNSEVSICDFPGTKDSIQWPPLEAVIEFGIGGVSTKVIVDYVNGVTLSVVASFLRVRALVTQSKSKYDGEIVGTSAAYRLAAHVGPGFAAAHVQRTVFVGDIGDRDESRVFDVPRFAKVASVMGCRHRPNRSPLLMVGWIRFWQDPKGEHGVGDAFVPDQQSCIKVPNAAQYFSVVNESGHKMDASVIFELGL